MSDAEPAQAQAVIWIIGQAGHGKTTLAAAIAHCLSKAGAPRTRRYVEIEGAQGSPERAKDAILVLSAAEGPMPQTRDHLKLARQAGVSRVVVFLNKIDVADKDLVELIEMEMRELLTICEFAGDKATVIRGSAARALEGDASAMGEPSIQKLLRSLGVAASGSASDPDVAKSGGLGDFFRGLFS